MVPKPEDVPGLYCASSATSCKDIEPNNCKDGVADAQVNLGTESATVEYDPTQVRLTDLEKAVTDAGYGVIPTKWKYP